MEVTNRFKGLGLVDGVPEELWIEVCNIVQDDQNHPLEKEMQKAKWLSKEALQTAEKRREEILKKEIESKILTMSFNIRYYQILINRQVDHLYGLLFL